MTTIELIRELILVASAIIFICGATQFLKDNMSAGCILVGYSSLPFAIDCMINKLYIYFIVWVVVCYIAFRLLYDISKVEDQLYEQELDNILNES